ncbi:hypothetical protein GCM10027275_16540 [Rhabdobacter roseus]|uniref:Uncharacterized protein n=1 Tax=Rhabdobacter roseus TaxID=1655419 RepID=A0A840TKW3_9BACT|nr:hypothetical protein [Rhabdobacter roseus]
MLTGKELFEKYRQLGLQAGPGTEASQYAGTLFCGMIIQGEAAVFRLLEEAEAKGNKLALTFPLPFEKGPSEPSGLALED